MCNQKCCIIIKISQNISKNLHSTSSYLMNTLKFPNYDYFYYPPPLLAFNNNKPVGVPTVALHNYSRFQPTTIRAL